MSIVEQILLEDSSGVYRHMDFATRDEYRHVIDRLAKRSKISEAGIARVAIELAQHVGDTPQVHTRHVGYYLVDRGLPQLERAVAARLPLSERLLRGCSHVRLPLYLGAILTVVLITAAGFFRMAQSFNIGGWQLGVLTLLALVASTSLASALVNWVATLTVKPKRLPRLDFVQGIPQELATLVVVPTLLTSTRGVDDLLEALEVRFLGNRDEHLYFGLLTDFGDADSETLPGDEALLARARAGIERLNKVYPSGAAANRFFLFHRPRLWNPTVKRWMGYERKRGKLADLNQLLREGQSGAFSLIVGDITALPQLRYVITLDTDTQLPRDAARQFVGTMAHPLNRPVYDPENHVIRRGYGILQPRMAATLSAANCSRYVQLYGGEPGIDPYTRSVSDVYQDVFGEGSFIGKGIYDLDAFEQVLAGAFPTTASSATICWRAVTRAPVY